MGYMKERTPKMEEGMERDLMLFILEEVKDQRGLTTCLDYSAGINGKWLKPDEVYNFRSNILLKILLYMPCVLKVETAREEWMKIFNKAVEIKKAYSPCRGSNIHKR